MFPEDDSDQQVTSDQGPPSAIRPPSPGPFGRYMSQLGMGLAKGVANSSPLGSAMMNSFSHPPGPVQGPPPGAGSPSSNLVQSGGGPEMGGVSLPQTQQAPPPPPDSSGGPMSSSWGQSAPKSPLTAGLRPGQGASAPGAGAASSGRGLEDAAASQAAEGAASSGAGAESLLSTAGALAPLLLKGGGLITKPTLAKIGEHGPEAVIPLTPRPGNKLQPDLLEGHGPPAQPHGMKYNRYRSYVNPAFK